MERRREYRLVAQVPGSYQKIGMPPHDIVFGAISANGCRLDRVEPHIGIGDVIMLNLGPIGPLKATIRWRRDEAAGVEFHEALEHAVVDFFAIYCGTAA